MDRALIAAAYRERENDRDGKNYQGETTWRSQDNLHLQPSYASLLEIIDAAIEVRWRAVGWSKKRYPWKICGLWANIAGPDDFTFEHLHMGHAGSIFSGIYYAQVPTGGGSIRVRSPDTFPASFGRTSLTQYKPFDMPRWWELEPKAGDILLFPNWLPHLVTPNRSKKDRIAWVFLAQIGAPYRRKSGDKLEWTRSEYHPDWLQAAETLVAEFRRCLARTRRK